MRGDRVDNLKTLRGRSWDTVIDTCGYTPRAVKNTARLLANRVNQYVFVSSISVFADFVAAGIDEDNLPDILIDCRIDKLNVRTYAPLKALCEEAIELFFPERALIIRPGLTVGPYDPMDRFTYWPYRIARGGKVLAPEPRYLPVTFIDVRDLSDWIIRMVERGKTGVYKVSGPEKNLTMKQLLIACSEVSNNGAEFIRVDKDFLLKRNVTPWSELPMWLPEKNYPGMKSNGLEKALTEGLNIRDLNDTISDTLAWCNGRPEDYKWMTGLAPDKERELLTDWYVNSNHIRT